VTGSAHFNAGSLTQRGLVTLFSSFNAQDYAQFGGQLYLGENAAFTGINFRQQDKYYIVFLANKLTVVGLGFLALAMTGVIYLITDVLYGSTATAVAAAATLLAFAVLWYAIPIWRRMRRGGSST